MLRKAFLFLFFCLAAFMLQAAPKQVQVFFSFGIYSTAEGKPYVEVYTRIPAATLNFSRTADKKYVAGADAKLYIFRNDTVVFKNEYTLQTAPMDDTSNPAAILDIKRFELPNGLYDLVLMIEDREDSFSNAQLDIPIQVSVSNENLQMADLLFFDTLYPVTQPDAFTRYGFNFIPSVSNIFPPERKTLLFFTEIYNVIPTLGKGNFTYMVSVKNALGAPVKGLEKTKVLKASKLNYLFDGIDISKLPGGEYYLQLEVLDNTGKPVARREKYFIRLTENFMLAKGSQNSIFKGLSAENIKEFVPYLEPIASKADIENFSKASGKDSISLQEWFYDFWKNRNPEDPEKAYTDYVKALTEVQKNFGSMLSQGYRTDRGWIYLKYGRPDYVAPYIDEPNAYPYEIWHYYKTSTKNNVKFIFYNPTQINNDYILLHSEMPSEKQNPNWKRMIYRRTDKSKSIDDNKSPNNFGDGLEDRIRE